MEIKKALNVIIVFYFMMACSYAGRRVDVTKTCNSEADCGSDECCVPDSNQVTKRGMPKAPLPIFINSGICRKIGTLNDSCFVDQKEKAGVIRECPCEKGFFCEGAGLKSPFGEIGTCKPIQKVCRNNGDCLNTQCCRCPLMRKGKRQIEPCVCQDNGVNGAQCIVEHNNVDLMTFERFCPCSNGFTCHGNGMKEVPLGEHGKCKPIQKVCRNNGDCLNTQCCRCPLMRKGKRQIEPCVCQDHGVDGDKCIVEHNAAVLLTFEKFCPCSNGFTCHGNGIKEIPLGEHGECMAVEGTPVEKECEDSYDCGEGQCCKCPLMRKGKMQIQQKCVCADVGKRHGTCIVEHMQTTHETYEMFCPCGPRLLCLGNNKHEIPLGEYGKCMAAGDLARGRPILPPVETRTPCTSRKQCKKDECCLSIHRPIGKRGLEEQPQAYCEKRGICNEGCLMNNGNRKRPESGKVFVGECPCAKGLKCTPNGMTDIPLGPMGTCEPKRRKFRERKCKKLRG
ncbi:unnamed protein product [Owenia fusiformis]|uniref:Uncharacterized protein n=1 Tax=Owenia fusiformis TaxID=6347 RepID=A0A8S4NPY1_OWEFU|nr:unnamed protein product [Owenia fusiformis]